MSNVSIAPLLEPIKIGSLQLRNRILMSPVVRVIEPDGVPRDAHVQYYRKRAEGGVGAIYVGSFLIEHPGNNEAFGEGPASAPHINSQEARDGWRKVAAAVHEAGGLIFPQLIHVGLQKKVTGKADDIGYGPSPTWGPTDRNTGSTPEAVAALSQRPIHALTDAEVVEVIEAFAIAAKRAKDIGFDGIALHGAHGYLIDGFLCGDTNLRTDRWGGDHVGRTRFVAEIIKAVRREVGNGMPISLRFSQWRPQDYDGRIAETPQKLEEILRPIVDAGIDILEASTRDFSEPAFEGLPDGLPYWTRKLTGKATVMCGGTGVRRGRYDDAMTPPQTVNNMDEVMRRYEHGDFDLLAVGRSLVNDPMWLRRARAREDFLPFNGKCLNPRYVE